MALPTIAIASAAVDTLYSIFADRKTQGGNRQAVAVLNELAETVKRAYASILTVSITDATDAGVSEALAVTGEIGIAAGRVLGTGEIFTLAVITTDLTDNALATAKGSGTAVGDRFQVTGADAVKYLGGATEVSFADELTSTFVSIGS